MAETLPVTLPTSPSLRFSPDVRQLLRSTPFRLYLWVIFAWSVSDSVISTLSSVLIESAVANTFLLGIIFAFSSLVGFGCDLLFSKIFVAKPMPFFLKAALILSIALPLLFLFAPITIPILLLAMAIWGIYYEFLTFSDFSFIDQVAQKHQFSAAMGLIQTTYAIMFVISAPIIGYLARSSYKLPFFIGVVALVFASLTARSLFKHLRLHQVRRETPPAFTTGQTVHIWLVLLKRVWPMYVFFIVVYLCNVTNWTIGTLLAYQMQSTHIVGYFLVSTFTLPIIFVTLIPPWIAARFSKKRASFIGGMIAGACFVAVGLMQTPWMIVASIFLGTTAMSIIMPLTRAVFEDYVHRLHEYRLIMVGLQASAVSLAYILGPILIGGIAQLTNFTATYSIIGGLVFITSVIFLLTVRGKIKMPQQELEIIHHQVQHGQKSGK